MNRLLYSLLLTLLLPAILIYLLWRSRKNPEYRHRWSERFGLTLPQINDAIVVHCASMGETLAAVPLIEALMARYPGKPILVTSFTPSGSEQVRQRFGDRVAHCYLPLDLPFVVARFVKRLRPSLVVLMETELWPNLIHQCHKRQVPVMLSNARMSERSARGYARFRRLTRPMLAELDAVAAQNAEDGARLVTLGLDPAKLTLCGSLKFDLDLSRANLGDLQQARETGFGDRKIWCAGSTHPGEFEQALAAHRALLRLHPDLLMLLVPRHPEQFEHAETLAKEAGFETVRRSAGGNVAQAVQVVIGDTMGELLTLYGLADAAFVGGSLIERGGHNPLEPAALAKPVLMGPHFFNFQEIGQTLLQAGGMALVNNADELADQLEHLLSLRKQAEQMGHQGQRVVDTNRGATERQLALASTLL
ncbi:lipid IV(A) 3-deoxy-D-manno-octulosonic acid transferase [Ferrimonas balearica]|uniref:lipid IV(A) 3-deoxy-D-manno-octulosonic acid transferase n=1 Tax=Ferrimonas balearica TaxID=44012 RepID=UPI001C9A28F5|nr:lipid IV(A) 3-deoxy-D-manno-octulosonic acid transferase [Ferrimonas balearica]MBY5923354.1 lipid IV(A) 3-deoxy-D-manno-octulosonic acid transferase [Ferrimonas balearica]MBY5995312.1 lipid IV(A) 3-deoxy-D-manno-octulosonic acid transferase [Ferrimonas balearica]